jgi:hypothetical protein
MPLIQAELHIRGIRPLLINRFRTESILAELKGRKRRSGVAGGDPDEWKETFLMTTQRQLYLEPTCLFGCLRDGAAFIRRGKGSLQPLLVATLQICDERILLNCYVPERLDEIPFGPVQGAALYIDVRSVKNPGTKARNVRSRLTLAAGWEAKARICWDESMLSRQEKEAIARDAGMFAGIGDGRRLGFGRFELVVFKIIKEEHAVEKDAT